jgi:hypothetical protein
MPNQVHGAFLHAPCPVPSGPACEPNSGSVLSSVSTTAYSSRGGRHGYAIKWIAGKPAVSPRGIDPTPQQAGRIVRPDVRSTSRPDTIQTSATKELIGVLGMRTALAESGVRCGPRNQFLLCLQELRRLNSVAVLVFSMHWVQFGTFSDNSNPIPRLSASSNRHASSSTLLAAFCSLY